MKTKEPTQLSALQPQQGSQSPLLSGDFKLTEEHVWQRLRTIPDPELQIDIVSLGLIYTVTLREVQDTQADRAIPYVHIVYTLTTPGCPLAGVFEGLIRDALTGIADFDPKKQIFTELTFDPPWIPDMMSEEARAELGF